MNHCDITTRHSSMFLVTKITDFLLNFLKATIRFDSEMIVEMSI
jgi:hypothetical protein